MECNATLKFLKKNVWTELSNMNKTDSCFVGGKCVLVIAWFNLFQCEWHDNKLFLEPPFKGRSTFRFSIMLALHFFNALKYGSKSFMKTWTTPVMTHCGVFLMLVDCLSDISRLTQCSARQCKAMQCNAKQCKAMQEKTDRWIPFFITEYTLCSLHHWHSAENVNWKHVNTIILILYVRPSPNPWFPRRERSWSVFYKFTVFRTLSTIAVYYSASSLLLFTYMYNIYIGYKNKNLPHITLEHQHSLYICLIN